jgi:hypothetical protein
MTISSPSLSEWVAGGHIHAIALFSVFAPLILRSYECPSSNSLPFCRGRSGGSNRLHGLKSRLVIAKSYLPLAVEVVERSALAVNSWILPHHRLTDQSVSYTTLPSWEYPLRSSSLPAVVE